MQQGGKIQRGSAATQHGYPLLCDIVSPAVLTRVRHQFRRQAGEKVRHMLELLDAGGEAGKKLDFLLQEMNRETNTILSKTSGAGEAGMRITELALGAKAAIEKIREQSLNLE